MLPTASNKRFTAYTILGNCLILLAANVLTIYLFTSQKASVWQILVTYYFQTVLIVFFYYKRLRFANVTQIIHRLPYASLSTKLAIWHSETISEQFLIIFTFGVPLAIMLFIILLNFSGNSLFGALPVDISSMHPVSILFGAGLFFIHHIVSYGNQLWQYRRGLVSQLTTPIVPITVRVYSLLLLLFFLPIIFANGHTNALFYLFIALKTILDLVLSNSALLLQSLWQK